MKRIEVEFRFGPEGTSDNSPAIYRRVFANKMYLRPGGTPDIFAWFSNAGLFSTVPPGRIGFWLRSFPAINCRTIVKCPSGTNVSLGFLLIAIVLSLLSISHALADGGAVQFSQRAGDLNITVMTDPTPLRVGAIDLSILTQNARSGEIANTYRTIVILRQMDEPALLIRAEATTSAATNKLLRSAKIELPRPGRWHLEIQHPDIVPAIQVSGELQVADKPPRWRQAAGWIMIPFVPIGMYIVGELLAARRGKVGQATA